MENQNEVDSPQKMVPQAQEHPSHYNDGDYDGYNQNHPDDGMYGDDGDGMDNEVSQALKATRLNKKKAAEDARLLANRIALLKLEEKKAWKKIQETKRKAEQVMEVRQRNEEDRQRKEQMRFQREQDEEQRMMQNNAMKEQQRQAILQQNQAQQMKILTEAQRLKEESMRMNDAIEQQRQQEIIKNRTIKQMIQQQKSEAEQRKEMERNEKRLQQRNRLINSILEENHIRMEIEAKVAELEKEEYELIQRLQNTSNIQKQAYEDLEGALNGQLSPEQLEDQFGLTPNKNGSHMSRALSRGGQ